MSIIVQRLLAILSLAAVRAPALRIGEGAEVPDCLAHGGPGDASTCPSANPETLAGGASSLSEVAGSSPGDSTFTLSKKMLAISEMNPLMTVERWEEDLKRKCCCKVFGHVDSSPKFCEAGEYNEMQKARVRETLAGNFDGDYRPW